MLNRTLSGFAVDAGCAVMEPVVLNHRLTLETAVKTPDGAGGYTESWVADGVLWANVDARSGRIRNGAGAELSVVRYRIIVRAAPVGTDMRPRADQRLIGNNVVYHIDAVAPYDAAGHYLECWAHMEVAT